MTALTIFLSALLGACAFGDVLVWMRERGGERFVRATRGAVTVPRGRQ